MKLIILKYKKIFLITVVIIGLLLLGILSAHTYVSSVGGFDFERTQEMELMLPKCYGISISLNSEKKGGGFRGLNESLCIGFLKYPKDWFSAQE